MINLINFKQRSLGILFHVNNLLAVPNFKMAFSKAMPEAFCVTLFNGSCDNDEVKSHCIYMQSKHCTITCNTILCCFIVSLMYLENLACCTACASLLSAII